jgi:hypothetical protein
MTKHAGACALAAACAWAASVHGVRAEVLDGVQPAALDQPQINMIIYIGDNALPQVGQAPDFLDLGTVPFFNVQAYLDTGASGILVSTGAANLLNVGTASSGGVPVIYSDVGVAGTDDFNVSVPVRLSLAPYLPGADMDQFADESQTIPITTAYTPVPGSGSLRVQVGPYVPTVDNAGMDDIDQLIAELTSGVGALDVVGMPAMKGRVMVVDPSGVKNLGMLFGVLGGILNGTETNYDLTDEQLLQLDSAGVKTYLYDRPTAPAFDANRTNNPGIPTAQRHVALSYGSFDRFTKVTLGPGGPIQPGLPAPTLEHNPFIGKNPVALLEGQPAGDAPGITITRTVGAGAPLAVTGNWLLDTGAAASIISEAQAAALHVVYDRAGGNGPGEPGTATPILIDAITQETIPDQFTLTLGGIGGQEVLAGFWLDSLCLPTKEATASGNEALNIYFTYVPVLVGDITVADPLDPDNPSKQLTLDGIFGMNLLIESINLQTNDAGEIMDIGAPSPNFFQWITFDEPNAELGLVFDPDTVDVVPEPTSIGLLGAGMAGLLARRRRGARS